jgi:hypothetical protein
MILAGCAVLVPTGLGVWGAATAAELRRVQTKSQDRFFMFSAVKDLQYPVS